MLAAINGHAIGIGLTLAMQCDIRLVAEDAKLGFVHVRRGVIPDAHSHWTVPRAVGFARAADLLLTGRTFTGREAARARPREPRPARRTTCCPPRSTSHATSPCTPRRCRSR